MFFAMALLVKLLSYLKRCVMYISSFMTILITACLFFNLMKKYSCCTQNSNEGTNERLFGKMTKYLTHQSVPSV